MITITMRNFITALMALFILSLSGLALAGATPCRDSCYKEKSVAYQTCRTIPPGERANRVACFKKADSALQQCLAKCK